MARTGLKGVSYLKGQAAGKGGVGTDDVSELFNCHSMRTAFQQAPFSWALGWFSLLPDLCEYLHGWSQQSIHFSLNFLTKAASRNPTPSPKSRSKRYSDIEQDFWKSYLFFWTIH